jgi:hypothetical protein
MKPINTPIHRPPTCAFCGEPATGPLAVQFLGQKFHAPICREKWREIERERDAPRHESYHWQELALRKLAKGQ